MAVYSAQREVSPAEFVRVANDLLVYTIEQVNKFPKSQRFILSQRLLDAAFDIYDNIQSGNAIYMHKNITLNEKNARENNFILAKQKLATFGGLLNITYQYVSLGNNFLGDSEKVSKIFLHWTELVNEEKNLITGVIASDKRKLQSYNEEKD